MVKALASPPNFCVCAAMSAASAAPAAHDPYAALRIREYRDYLGGNFLALIGRQGVITVALWQVYAWTHSLAAVGMVGFINVLPLLALSLPAGMLTDHFDRKRLIVLGTATLGLLNVALTALAYWHEAVPPWAPLRAANAALRAAALLFERGEATTAIDFSNPALPLLFLVLLLHATARVLMWPARASITPLLVPAPIFSNAITWNTSAFEIATISGPLLAGFALSRTGIAWIYGVGAALELVFLWLLRRVVYHQAPARAPLQRSWKDMLAGAAFIWRKPVILGASSLDLFAVLLGGVTAVLPVYADKILHVGPAGFGCLRAAPSVGALAMALWIAHRPPMQRPGRALLWAVAGFGAAIVAFGVSRSFWLSLGALFLTGAFDNVSVVVRQSLVQLLTPDTLRGRVTAVNQMFIGSSNEIGALRAGLMAALIGPVAAVVWGGIGTVAVALVVASAVPGLRRLPPLHSLRSDT